MTDKAAYNGSTDDDATPREACLRDGLILDLFAGPGGWSEGLRMLGLSDVGIEKDEWACKTRAAAGHQTIRADVATYPTEPFVGKVWGLIASPPCQDFSIAGQKAGIGGDRGLLVWQVPRWVKALMPEWVVCEQVPEVEPIWRKIAHWMSTERAYGVTVARLNAADYGVPQDRERAFLIAHRTRRAAVPDPTHGREAGDGLFGPVAPRRAMGPAVGRGDGWRLEHIRGAGMVERHGQRPPRYPHEPSFTVLAWKDSRMRWVHEDGRRERFGVRDSLLLQTFREDYPVQGSDTRAQEQIGNAVPPLLAAHVLSAVTGISLAEDVAA